MIDWYSPTAAKATARPIPTRASARGAQSGNGARATTPSSSAKGSVK